MDGLLSGQNKTLLLLGTVSIATLTSIYFYFNSNQKCSETLLPALELEETQKIMSKILDKLKFVALKHSRAGQHIKMQLEQQGQNMSEEEVMRHFILPHFENAFESAQEEVLDEFDVDESELEEAATYYSENGDAKLKEIISKIELMHKQFGGENNSTRGGSAVSAGGSGGDSGGSSQELSLNQVIRLLQDLSDKVNEATDQFIEEFKETYGQPNGGNMLQFQQGMLQMSEGMEAAVLESHGVTSEVFQKSLIAHQHNQLLQQTVMAMQMENQQRLAQHGIQLQM